MATNDPFPCDICDFNSTTNQGRTAHGLKCYGGVPGSDKINAIKRNFVNGIFSPAIRKLMDTVSKYIEYLVYLG